MYELIIIWTDGSKNVYPYQTEEEARHGERNMRMAFGNQFLGLALERVEDKRRCRNDGIKTT